MVSGSRDMPSFTFQQLIAVLNFQSKKTTIPLSSRQRTKLSFNSLWLASVVFFNVLFRYQYKLQLSGHFKYRK